MFRSFLILLAVCVFLPNIAHSAEKSECLESNNNFIELYNRVESASPFMHPVSKKTIGLMLSLCEGTVPSLSTSQIKNIILQMSLARIELRIKEYQFGYRLVDLEKTDDRTKYLVWFEPMQETINSGSDAARMNLLQHYKANYQSNSSSEYANFELTEVHFQLMGKSMRYWGTQQGDIYKTTIGQRRMELLKKEFPDQYKYEIDYKLKSDSELLENSLSFYTDKLIGRLAAAHVSTSGHNKRLR